MKKFGLWIGATMMAMPMIAGAAPETLPGSEISSWPDLIRKADTLIGYFIAAVAVVATAMIIWGGLLYAQGDADNGRGKVTAGVIGLVIALLAYSIVKIVISLI